MVNHREEAVKIDLLKDKINKLYLTFVVSALGSTLVTNIYAFFDTMCVGRYSGHVGIAAISCVNPFWPLMLCFGILAGMGGSVLMNNRRGANDLRTADEFFTVSMMMTAFASILVAIIVLVFRRPLLVLFGAEGEVMDACLEYMVPIAIVSPTFSVCASVATFMRNDGEAILPTVATITGGVFNILGDIFFVFDFGLGLGVFGAGLATAIGQFVSFVMLISYFFMKKCKLRFVIPKRIPAKILQICAVGSTAFLTEISFGVTVIVFNNIIMDRMSSQHLAVFGTASSIVVMFYCFYYALGTGLQPIVSANTGAGNRERAKSTLRIASIFAIVLGAILFLLVYIFPEFLLRIFMDNADEVMDIGPRILRSYSCHLPIVGIGIISCYYLQSTLKRGFAFVVSLLRGLLLPIIFAPLSVYFIGNDALWFSLPAAEMITTGIAILFIVISGKRIEKTKAENDIGYDSL